MGRQSAPWPTVSNVALGVGISHIQAADDGVLGLLDQTQSRLLRIDGVDLGTGAKLMRRRAQGAPRPSQTVLPVSGASQCRTTASKKAAADDASPPLSASFR